MDYQMTNKATRVMTTHALLLISTLLIAACDGGIFGTGGSDTAATDPLSSAGLTTDGMSQAAPDTPGNVPGSTAGDSDDNGTTDSSTEGDTTGSNETGTTTGAVGIETPAVDTGGDTAMQATDGIGDAGATDSDSTDAGTADSGAESNDLSVSAGDDGTFINSTPTLVESDAQLVVINTSTQTLNILGLSFILNNDPPINSVAFELAGVEPNTVSENTVIGDEASSLTIADNNDPAQVLVSYSEFIAGPSTLTTLLIRENAFGINAVALVTETQTSDPGLAKVRIVQGGTLGDSSIESQLRLQSAGENPGGVDDTFGPVSFNRPQSDYTELPAGDYELIDLANRFPPVAVTLSGGTVYTLLLTGSGVNEVNIIIDSEGR